MVESAEMTRLTVMISNKVGTRLPEPKKTMAIFRLRLSWTLERR